MPAPLVLAFLDDVADYVSGSPLTYAALFLVSGLDAFFPIVPSETAVIAAGTLAATGDLLLWVVIPAAALGAFAGDNVSYGLGALFGERAAKRLFRGEKGRRRLARAQRLLDRYGVLVIVTARFVPGGRTVTTFACGTLDMTWRRFLVYDAVAVVIWATYAAMIGYLGGTAFREDIWKALLLGFGIAVAVTGLFELVRRLRRVEFLP
ncbi:MAG: DedA family protein [Thermoleophilia bacterium]|nr:DedA family protein [Thermoleophilia bacterium]